MGSGQGAKALQPWGCQSHQVCLLSPCVSLGSLFLAVSPYPRLCVSLSPGLLVPCFCLWVSATHYLSLTLLSPFSLLFFSFPFCPFCLSLSSSPGSVSLPLLPPTP